MNTKKFSEAMGEIDERYIEKAIAYQAKKASAAHTKRWWLPLVAAIMTILLIGTAVAAVVLFGDLWRQNPSDNPVESVRSALENQVEKDYTIKNLYSQPQTPCGRVFSRHTALRFLEMHQAFPRKRALSGGKILRPPSILGCEYRF